MRRNARGFTLLEVLVALFILAIALAAIMRNLSDAITTTGALRHRTMALWVADNRLAHIETVSKWPALGRRTTTAREDHRRFIVDTDVVTTPVSTLRRINIRVRGGRHRHGLAELVGFVREP
ncbi:MAG: type II secretion system minor pseudopilin GspI [Acidiferrobacter sp.]